MGTVLIELSVYLACKKIFNDLLKAEMHQLRSLFEAMCTS